MNTKNLFNLAVIVLLSSCNTSSPDTDNKVVVTEQVEQPAEQQTVAATEASTLEKQEITKDIIFAYYVGKFEAKIMDDKKSPMYQNRINISIDSMVDNILFGHSVVAGSIRPFTGDFSIDKGKYIAECKEPGDDKYDGVFTFTLDPAYGGSIIGTWESNDKKIAVTKRAYRLERMAFKYDSTLALEDTWAEVYNSYSSVSDSHEEITEDAGKFNASTTLLTKKEIENMYKRDLEVMRNAIYARHGYSFKNREMRYFFDKQVSWYVPVSIDVTKDLTDLEKKNIDLIKRYEKHAESYYDEYGR